MRKALAIDLDGTLLHTNTFRDYLQFCYNVALHRFHFLTAWTIVWWVTLRKMRFVSHSRMKAALLECTASFMMHAGRLDQFVEQELLLINQPVLQFMEQYRNRGYLLILCTAAPGLYAHPIAENLHIDLCCATLLPSEIVIGNWWECVGTYKVDALNRMLQVQKAELAVVITDHYHDIPLLNANAHGENYLVAPSEKTLQMLKKQCTSPYTSLAN